MSDTIEKIAGEISAYVGAGDDANIDKLALWATRLRAIAAAPSRGVVDEVLDGKLRCLASLLQQLNAQTACAAVNEARAALQAAALPAVPEGWVLVPREPTDSMIHAGMDAEVAEYRKPGPIRPRRAMYRAMLAAAPAQGEVEGG